MANEILFYSRWSHMFSLRMKPASPIGCEVLVLNAGAKESSYTPQATVYRVTVIIHITLAKASNAFTNESD